LTPTNIVFKVTPTNAVKEQALITLTASAEIWTASLGVTCACVGGTTSIPVMQTRVQQSPGAIDIQMGGDSAANQELTFTCTGGLASVENTATPITFSAMSTADPTVISAQTGYSVKTKIGWGSALVPMLVAESALTQIVFTLTPTHAVLATNTITLTASKALWSLADATSVTCTCAGATSVAVTSSTTSQTTTLADTLAIVMGAGSAAGQVLIFTCLGGLKGPYKSIFKIGLKTIIMWVWPFHLISQTWFRAQAPSMGGVRPRLDHPPSSQRSRTEKVQFFHHLLPLLNGQRNR
jgi:hypothetical protein